MKKTILLVFVLAALTSGCATTGKLDPVLQNVTTISQVQRHLGPPHNVQQMPDGSHVYLWSTARNVSVGGYPVYNPGQYQTGHIYTPGSPRVSTYTYQTPGYTTYTPVQNVNLQCQVRIVANSNGRITDWAYTGNDCNSLVINEYVPTQRVENAQRIPVQAAHPNMSPKTGESSAK